MLRGLLCAVLADSQTSWPLWEEDLSACVELRCCSEQLAEGTEPRLGLLQSLSLCCCVAHCVFGDARTQLVVG